MENRPEVLACVAATVKLGGVAAMLNHHQRGDALTHSIELTRPRWYWTDDRAVSTRQTARIKYDVLTRQYTVSVTGSSRS